MFNQLYSMCCMLLCHILTVLQRISEIDYDKVGQAVLRLKAIYKDLQDEDQDEVSLPCYNVYGDH